MRGLVFTCPNCSALLMLEKCLKNGLLLLRADQMMGCCRRCPCSPGPSPRCVCCCLVGSSACWWLRISS